MEDLPWTWLLIRASGLTAWALLTAVVAWGLLLRTRLAGPALTPLTLLGVHRWLGTLALGFLAGHLGLLLVDPYVRFTVPELLVPFAAGWRPGEVALGIAALWLMLGVGAVARVRPWLGKRGATWFKRNHKAAYAAWPLATGHYVLAGTDATQAWSMGLLLTGTGVLVFLLLARGLVPKPARQPRPNTTAKEPSRVV